MQLKVSTKGIFKTQDIFDEKYIHFVFLSCLLYSCMRDINELNRAGQNQNQNHKITKPKKCQKKIKEQNKNENHSFFEEKSFG